MERTSTEEEPRRLADFLRTHRDRILSDWLAAVRRLAPARDLDRPILLDYLPRFLAELADFLDDVRAGNPATEPEKLPAMHALERLEVGYDLAEVVEEYAILRTCIIDLVHHESAPAMRSAQLARLHSGIDRAIVTSTARYHEASERTLRALDRISSAALTHRDPEKMLPELLKVLLETCASVDAASLLGEDLIGVATIGSASSAEFSDEDCLLFRTMSARAAALIAQARLNAELARRNAELANALEYRDRILGVLSHDLRNPLGVILMSAELLGRGGPLSARQQRSVGRMADNARRVDHMVRDLLDYTRSRQRQTLPISPRKGDLLTLCHEVLEGLQLLHPRVELRCTAEGRTDGWIDPERAVQVSSN